MSLYTKALNHIDMSRVKELHEEKIKRKRIVDEIREQIREELRNINSPEFSNWRFDLDEGMTTSSIYNTTLPARGEVNLGTAIETFSLSGPGGGHPDSFNKDEPSTIGNYEQFDTIVVTVNSTTPRWSINPIDSLDELGSGGVGTHQVVIPRTYPGLFFAAFDTGTITVSATYQRRAPVNAFVSLDSPEASNFIRTDPIMQGLSAEDRKKKLIDMLDAGDEYLLKQLGITGSKARPSDTTMPPSWEQASGNPRGDSVPIDPKTGMPYPFGPSEFPGGNPQAKTDSGDTEVAMIRDRPGESPNNIQWPRKPGQKTKPGPGARPSNQPMGPRLPLAKKKQKAMVAHHEPKGKVLSEKKKFKSPKDITSKIPGYYDGKPAPLGFPMQEPPKTVNGKHPDLVDGKKIANRFNRLDPQSAKAMPPTGNPHIDKKVRAAAKKPK
jgi:hypothetical protein